MVIERASKRSLRAALHNYVAFSGCKRCMSGRVRDENIKPAAPWTTALWRKAYLASRVASSRGDKSYSDLEGLYSSPSTLCEACAIEHSARTDCLAEDDAHCAHTRCNIATSVSVSHTTQTRRHCVHLAFRNTSNKNA